MTQTTRRDFIKTIGAPAAVILAASVLPEHVEQNLGILLGAQSETKPPLAEAGEAKDRYGFFGPPNISPGFMTLLSDDTPVAVRPLKLVPGAQSPFFESEWTADRAVYISHVTMLAPGGTYEDGTVFATASRGDVHVNLIAGDTLHVTLALAIAPMDDDYLKSDGHDFTEELKTTLKIRPPEVSNNL